MKTYDILIRGGTIVDGTGAAPYVADLAIRDGQIVEIGDLTGVAREEIAADGFLVTPGFVDVHTHYDGQVTWDTRLNPSSNHGVTTAIFGNCGVGFAPARPHQREMMIKLMEGVEDIPGVVMAEGVPFNWETFPEYLDALDERRADIDFAAQVPHSPLRIYVMGERGLSMEPPTEEDLLEMRALVAEAVAAGALGVTTSRALVHRFRDGRYAPSVKTEEDELLALAAGLRDAGTGVFQLAPNADGSLPHEVALMRRVAEASGRPLSFTLMAGTRFDWRSAIDEMARAKADGVIMRAQSIPRSVGFLFGLDTSYHPFSLNPSYKAIAHLPLAERVAIMRDPEFKAKVLSEESEDENSFIVGLINRIDMLFRLDNPPNYLPGMEESFAARAAAEGRDEREFIYDELLREDGRAIILAPRGNIDGTNLAASQELFQHEGVLLGLGDGGAHYGMICDASVPTYFLTECVRDADPDHGIELPRAIKLMTHDAAIAMGLEDRGLLRPGYKADLNVIDFGRLELRRPEVVADLPANGRRLDQKAVGYVATIVSGEVIARDGDPTGKLPGRLVRGAQRAPALALAS